MNDFANGFASNRDSFQGCGNCIFRDPLRAAVAICITDGQGGSVGYVDRSGRERPVHHHHYILTFGRKG